MLNVNEYYYGGFNDFYPLWGTPIASNMDVEYSVQVENNSFTGESVGDGNYVNVQSTVEVPGNAIYCSAEATVSGSVSMQGNTLTHQMEDGNLSASAEFSMAAVQYFYSRGRNAVMDAEIEAMVNDNVIAGDTLFNGISVITSAYA